MKHRSRGEKVNILLVLLFFFAAAGGVLPLLIRNLTGALVPEHIRRTESGIQQESALLREKAAEASQNPALQQAVRESNSLLAFSSANAELEKAGATTLLVTNRDGKVVTQAPKPIGVAYYNSFPGALSDLKGIVASSRRTTFEELYLLPLGIVEGVAMRSSRRPAALGGIVLGKILDDAFARHFREQYLDPATEVVFYNRAHRIEGTSFENRRALNSLRAYLQFQESNLLSASGPDNHHHRNILFEERVYHIHNFKLKNAAEDVVGSMLVFIPIQPWALSMIIGALLSLLFFVSISLLRLRNLPPPGAPPSRSLLEVLLTLAYFFVITLVTEFLFIQSLAVIS